MKALVQRVLEASVEVDHKVIAEIENGLVVLLGVAEEDTEKDASYLAEKITNMRIFSDSEGKFNVNSLDLDAEILVISQFTLLADTRKGRRPSFIGAAQPEKANSLYNYFVQYLKESRLRVQTGRFAASMVVKIFNDGPVTIMLDSHDKYPVRISDTSS